MRFGNPSRKNGDRGFRTGQPTGVPVSVPESRPQSAPPPITTGRIPEVRVEFDPDGGHTHDGVTSALISLTGDVSGTNIATTVTKIEGRPIPAPAAGDDQKYIQYDNGTGAFRYAAPVTTGPLLDGGTRNTDTAAATPVAQDLVYANASNKWDRLAKGSSNTVLKVVTGVLSWSSVAFTELAGHLSDITSGDVTYTSNAGKVVAIQNQAVGAPSGTNTLLKWSGSALAWAAAAFSELTGTLSDAQHGTRTSGGGADHTGTLSANARLAVKKGGTLVGTRRAMNVIAGSNVSLTVTDDSVNEKVDVQIDVPTGAGATTTGPLLDGGTRNTDTAAATPVSQDLVCANASNKWDRLAKGSNNTVLKVVSGLVTWSSVAFSELTGTLSDAQHGTRTSGGGADHTGTLSANARVAVKKGGTLVGTRRTVNVIAGTNVTLTVTDDSANEKVDVQIDVPTGAGAATTGPLLDASRNTDTTAHTPVRGDLVVANSTPAWSALAAGTLPGLVLKMNSSSDPVWATPFSLLATFVRGVINSANVGNVMPVGAATNVSAGITMPYAGRVYALSITLDASIGAGATYSVQLYINGSPQLLSASVSSGSKAYNAVSAGSIAFSAGDTLTLVDGNSGSPGTHAAVGCIFGTAA